MTLEAGARRDVSGHDIAGSKQVGIVEWIPNNASARFQLRNVRYYYDASLANFESAFQLEGTLGNGKLMTLPLDASVGSSVIEVSNNE